MRPGITLLQLHAFTSVVRLGSFTAAAKRLRTTQPNISNRIRALEVLVGQELFFRNNQRPTLTPVGRALVAYAEKMVELGEAFEDLARPQEGPHGLIRIGAADSIALTWLSELLARFAASFPRMEVEVVVDLSANFYSRLVGGEIDLAFVAMEAQHRSLTSLHIGDAHNAWIASPSLRLDGGLRAAAELASHPVITFSCGSQLHEQVFRWFRGQGVTPTRVHTCNSLATMLELAAAGLGVSALPMCALNAAREQRRIVQIRTRRPLPSTHFYMVHGSGRRPALSEQIATMAKECARPYLVKSN